MPTNYNNVSTAYPVVSTADASSFLSALTSMTTTMTSSPHDYFSSAVAAASAMSTTTTLPPIGTIIDFYKGPTTIPPRPTASPFPVSLPPGNTPELIGNCSILDNYPEQCSQTRTCRYFPTASKCILKN